MKFLSSLTSALGDMLGPDVEVVLHDLRQPETSIVALANGHVTGRNVGDSINALGLELLRKQSFHDLVNYETVTRGGKRLRSSSVFLEDSSGKVIAGLCLNRDISSLVSMKEWVDRTLDVTKAAGPVSGKLVEERFERSVEEVLNRLIDEALQMTGKPVGALQREDKVGIIRHLESKGAFLIRYSMDMVAELLNMSKFTIYNYLQKELDGTEDVKSREGTQSTKPARPASKIVKKTIRRSKRR